MTGMNGPGRPGDDPEFRPDDLVPEPGFQADSGTGRPLRRRRQPVLAALAIIAVLLLVLAVGIFGGIF